MVVIGTGMHRWSPPPAYSACIFYFSTEGCHFPWPISFMLAIAMDID
jgi:hypothetical protein